MAALLPYPPVSPPPCGPGGTSEHSLALFSEPWEAGCRRRSQELGVSPEAREGGGRLRLQPSAPGPAEPQVPPWLRK